MSAPRITAGMEVTSGMRSETKWLVQSLERMHYLSKSVQSVDAEAFLERYMEAFDSNRLYFLAEDVEDLKERFVSPLQVYLRQGNLYPALEIFSVYRDRVLERVEFVFSRLKEDFDFHSDGFYGIDRSERDWPQDREAADALWERRLTFELLNRLLPALEDVEDEDFSEAFDEALEDAIERVQRRYERLRDYVMDLEPYEVQEVYLSTLSRQFDPHSSFFSAESHEDFAIAMENQLIGIGAVLTDEDGYCTIRELIPGGPAAMSNEISPGDRVVAVAQGEEGEWVDVVDMKLRKIVRKIRGEEDSLVRLLIWPAEATDPSVQREVRIIREQVKLTENLAKARLFSVPGEDSSVLVGMVELPSFYGNGDGTSSSSQDVGELIERMRDMGVEGIILDLRRNGGGLLNEAIRLTGLFITEGPVLQVRDHFGRVQKYSDDFGDFAWDGPLMVLVSRFSASGSEIVAGALRDYGRALIVGDPSTHGKGTVQGVFQRSLGRSAAAKITVSQYYLPSGASTQEKGVSADIVIPSVTPLLPVGEADLENAMPWQTMDPMEFDRKAMQAAFRSVSPGLIDTLRSRSLERQEELEEFAFLCERIDFVRQRQEAETISLNLEERLAERRLENEFWDRLEALADRVTKEDYEYEELLLRRVEVNEIPEEVDENEASLDDMDPVSGIGDLDIGLREGLRIMRDWVLVSMDLEGEDLQMAGGRWVQ